jgi:antitoxin component YwqK of YwqJK toxin-antitoxin module
MKRLFRYIIIFQLVLLLIYCTRKRVGNDSFVVISDGKGNIASEENYINDTILHGLAKYYYTDAHNKNVLKEEIEFKYGLKDGWHKTYRKDGTLESKSHWNNGLQNGMSYWYYENGNIQSESFWLKNKQYGNTQIYYNNKFLENYYSVDYFGNTLYIR